MILKLFDLFLLYYRCPKHSSLILSVKLLDQLKTNDLLNWDFDRDLKLKIMTNIYRF